MPTYDIYEYAGDYTMYELSSCNIKINNKTLHKYYKISTIEADLTRNTSYEAGRFHLFRYDNDSYDLIMVDTNGMSACNYGGSYKMFKKNFVLNHVTFDDLKTFSDKLYDLIGFANEQIVIALPSDAPDDTTKLIDLSRDVLTSTYLDLNKNCSIIDFTS